MTREYKTNQLTVKELKELNIPLSELVEVESMRFPMKWDSVLRLINGRMTKGEHITEESSITEVLEALGAVFESGFS